MSEMSSNSVDDLDSEVERGHLRKVEAALFISGRFLSLAELVSLTDINPLLLKKVLRDLVDKYKEGGIEIVQKNNLWKMDVAGEFLGMVNKLATGNSEFSKAEQETLAILAYKQPVKQSVIIKIRGNKAYEHIKKFSEMGLIVKKKFGHTAELSLSDSFFDYFSLGEKEGEGMRLADKDLLGLDDVETEVEVKVNTSSDESVEKSEEQGR